MTNGGLLPIGHRIYTVEVCARHKGGERYDYALRPSVNRIREIRIGKAVRDGDVDEGYGPLVSGPSDVTYIAMPEDGTTVLPCRAFSPYKDHLVCHGSTAGIENRGYLGLTQLYPYAMELKQAIEREWPDAESVVISPEIPKGDRRK